MKSRAEIERELKELEEKPMENAKPRLHMHPFLDAVFRPGISGYPITDPDPTLQRILGAMRWSDWLYVSGAMGFILYRAVPGATNRLRSTFYWTSAFLPLFLGVGMFKSYSRLVGLKGMDDL